MQAGSHPAAAAGGVPVPVSPLFSVVSQIALTFDYFLGSSPTISLAACKRQQQREVEAPGGQSDASRQRWMQAALPFTASSPAPAAAAAGGGRL